MTSHRYAWMDQALCAQADPDLWTTDVGGNTATPKRICARCPVQPACDAHATALHHFDGLAMRGVWGGRSKRQRDQQQRQAA